MRLNIFIRDRGGRGGVVRRTLRLLAPSVLRTPLRRAVQTACLGGYLLLLIVAAWPHEADGSARAVGGSWLNVEQVLQLDPLVAISSSLAARALVWPALAFAAAVLGACVLWPRWFCAYVCPLGTIIDVFDRLVGRRFARLHLPAPGWWTRGRFAILAGAILAAGLGVQLAGHVAAIPLLTRGLECLASPVQTGLGRSWHLVAPMTAAKWAAGVLLAAVVALGVLGRRFWCRCLCPTGAVMSICSLLRLTDRKVTPACVSCGKCRDVCSFGAIREDYTAGPAACTFCQECGGVCPAGAIQFTGRWSPVEEKPRVAAAAAAVRRDRRELLLACIGGLGAGAGLSVLARGSQAAPVRPPGAMAEAEFLRRCVRCGNCMRACPTGILQPAGLSGGLDGLWTPLANADFAGCDPECNNCTQVCPTGAIGDLTLDQKRGFRMGVAEVNETTCLPHAGIADCRLCVDACDHAGYRAIEFVRVGVELDELGQPIEDSGMLAPSVRPGRCVGCGLCQARCHAVNVRATGALSESAIVIYADGGAGMRRRGGRGTGGDGEQRGPSRGRRRHRGGRAETPEPAEPDPAEPTPTTQPPPTTQPTGGKYEIDF